MPAGEFGELFRLGQWPGPLPPLLLISWMFAGLIACFVGYPLFRVQLAVIALICGAVLGGILVEWQFDHPRGIDYFVICTALGLLGSLAAWFLYRLVFSLLVFGAITAVSCGLFVSITSASPANAWPWVVGALIGLGPAAVAFVYVRKVFIFLSGLLGALLAVFSAATCIAGSGYWPLGHWITWGLFALSIALGIVGMRTQSRLTRLLRLAFTPEQDRRKKAAAKKSGKTIRPRFSRP